MGASGGKPQAGEALPHASASLVGAPGGGHRIELAVPPPDRTDNLTLAALGWRALMVSGVAAEDDDTIVEWSVTWPGITPEHAQLMWSRLRSDAGVPLANAYPKIGTVSVDEARVQLAGNLDVMRSVFPADTVRRTRIVVVPVDASRRRFGLEADIRVSRLDDLKPKLGAVVGGLQTGLVGDPDAVIEGLAITVADGGSRRAGWFKATRTGVGIGIGPPGFGRDAAPVDVEFPNRTAGPRTAMPGPG
jgi:hypothetical protein